MTPFRQYLDAILQADRAEEELRATPFPLCAEFANPRVGRHVFVQWTEDLSLGVTFEAGAHRPDATSGTYGHAVLRDTYLVMSFPSRRALMHVVATAKRKYENSLLEHLEAP